jgi:hypothetical protein
MTFRVGEWVAMTEKQVEALHLDAEGLSAHFPDVQFVVVAYFVNADGTFSTDQPHKYPQERFTKHFRVLAMKCMPDDPQPLR